jgi:hypothetical protein
MYSGMYIFSKHSGALVGAHQKIDRIARTGLAGLLRSPQDFPSSKEILQFEGINGPDGIKLKSPGKDEPWHFVDPLDMSDDQLAKILENHYHELVRALKAKDTTRSAFEAAWLAHSLVDGLTPAHHFPFQQEMSKLRTAGKSQDRPTVTNKLIMSGENVRAKIRNNWQAWGPRGLYTTHIMFETGFATMIAPMGFRGVKVSQENVDELKGLGLPKWFSKQIQIVAAMKLYESFARRGWTIKLGRIARLQLAPLLVKDVTLIWWCAVLEAGMTPKAV